MKISELSTDRAADVLCDLSAYVLHILADEELVTTLRSEIGCEKMTRAAVLAAGAEKIVQLIPLVLKKHKQDVFGALAVLNETTSEDIAGQNIIKTMEMVKDAADDKELLDFFKSCAQAGGK